jgi:hypothetical protein
MGSTDANKVLNMNMLKGLFMANQTRIGVASGSSSIEEIRSTRNIPMITRQASIISGLQVSIPESFIYTLLEEVAGEQKVWTKDEIKELLSKNDKAVYRALKVIYSLQTDTEKRQEQTGEVNSVGFSSYDSKFLTSLAKQYSERGTLSVKQLEAARKGMMKYAGQLAKIANKKISVSV